MEKIFAYVLLAIVVGIIIYLLQAPTKKPKHEK
jgi:type III secretory pathway component EscS